MSDSLCTKADADTKKKWNFNTTIAVLLIVFWGGVYFLIPYQIAKPRLFLGRSLMGLEPTLFPTISVVLLISLSLWYLFVSKTIKEVNELVDMDREQIIKTIVTIAAFCAYTLMFDRLGFILSTVLFAGPLTIYFGARKPVTIILVCLVCPVCIYLLFTTLMHVYLP